MTQTEPAAGAASLIMGQPIDDGRPAGVWKPGHAFGVDPVRRQRYSLRQARYDAAATDIDRLAAQAQARGARLSVLDIGCKTGTMLRHLEHRPHFSAIEMDGADVSEYAIYKPELYRAVFRSDLMAGCLEIESGKYDVVICEQVLEHLRDIDKAISALERVLKPGGTLIVGVPIFTPPLAFLRRQVVSFSLLLEPGRYWSHIQTFSLWTFKRAMRRFSNLRFADVRGFRIASEGILMPLEEQFWWWQLNCRIGKRLPWACIEIQATYVKPA